MKVVIMNTTDTEGGAARCAHRLHKGIRQTGVNSSYVVQKKFGSDDDTIAPPSWAGGFMRDIRPGLDRLPMRLYRKRARSPFSTGLVTNYSYSKVHSLSPDIVNLHYVGEGFLPIDFLQRVDVPIVWTLHDSWPFTGGCHLPGDCLGYEKACGNCPILGSNHFQDLSHWTWKKKQRSWKDLNITIVTDSTWLADCARKSSLFESCRIEPINPGLSLSDYKPVDKTLARSILSLPQDKKLVLFGAMHSTSDPNKGFQFLEPAIQLLSRTALGADTELVIFGASRPKNPPEFGLKSHYFGRLHDDISLALLYSAADVMVVPSRRESFGQTASEALACGTPVVAFNATGLLDIVEHKVNGYLAAPYSPTDLASGISWVLSRDASEYGSLVARAREKAVSHFSIELMVERYLSLFKELTNTRHE